MKNLLPLIKTLGEPDDIKGILREKEFLNNYWWTWDRPGPHYAPTDKISPHTRAYRIIEKYMGKSFDDAFSEFCKQVPKCQQYIFLDEFTPSRSWLYPDYGINEEGNIVKYRVTKRNKWIFYSSDYATAWRHKKTGDLVSNNYWYGWRPSGNKEDYELIVTSGFAKEFESRWDPEFIRLKAERTKASKRAHKLRQRAKKEKLYCWLTNEELKRKREKQENFEKIIKHGFDPATSFRNNISPEVIELKRGY